MYHKGNAAVADHALRRGRCTYPSRQQHILRGLGVVAFDVPLAAVHHMEVLRVCGVDEALLDFALWTVEMRK